MNVRCSYESFEGQMCKRWAMRGSHFCYNHQPMQNPAAASDGASLHPLARLANPEDVFDVLRETLNAVRLGRIVPAQAYAVGFLAQLVLKVYDRVSQDHRTEALHRQLIPTLVDQETMIEVEAEMAEPLPVQLEEAAPDAARRAPLQPRPPAARHSVSAEFMEQLKKLDAALRARSGAGNAPATAPAPANANGNGHAAQVAASGL